MSTPVHDRYGSAPVQRRGAGKPTEDPAQVQALAGRGVKGAGGQLPHLELIQAAFAPYDVSNIQAHVGGDAASSATAMGAQAYATGNHVAFRTSPDLHTAAHEAAHVVQQRGGVQLLGGVGEVGDRYERHADAVADRVVAGRSAVDLFDGFLGSGGAANNQTTGSNGPVQRKQLSDKQLQVLYTMIVDALTVGKAGYKRVESAAHRNAIHALRIARSRSKSAKGRKNSLERGLRELHPVIAKLDDGKQSVINRHLADVKSDIGAQKAEEAVPLPTSDERREEMNEGPALTKAKLQPMSPAEAAKRGRDQLKTFFKNMSLLIDSGRIPAAQIESAWHMSRLNTSKPISVKSASGTIIAEFDPKGVNGISDLAGSGLSFFTAVFEKFEADEKLAESNHDQSEQIAFRVAGLKAVADATRSMVEIGMHATENIGEMMGKTELVDRVRKLRTGPGMQCLGGALAAADIVSNLFVLNSSTASTKDKEDAAAAVVIGAAKIAELAGLTGGAAIAIPLELTWLLTKWATANFWKARSGIMTAGMTTAYDQLAAHANAIQCDVVRLTAIAQMMELEGDAPTRAGMLTHWTKVGDSIGLTIRVLCEITAETNDLSAPGQFIQTLEPHFAFMRQNYADIGGGAEAVAAVDDVMATMKDAFDKQEHYTNVEIGVEDVPGINWAVGSFCMAEWQGKPYPATVREVNKPARAVRLHWDGYAEDADPTWYPIEKLHDPIEYCEGDRVEVLEDGTWYRATVIDDNGRAVTVDWTSSLGTAEVSHAKVRLDTTSVDIFDHDIGDRMEAEWEGKYYPVEILDVDWETGELVKVHWSGYDDAWDEWIDPSRLRK